ncbi:hypothetical protein FEV09_00175 [Pseudanabaena catenata USMAC16]|uniref:Uncharacterized protein n=2 Tax=Pseudanabaena TaxID=1152 RepID=L8N9F2_9CYAN|nr:hypothetical protein [Pseudanabaena catenata]ELS34848.1 hypothetical protein Pse7429DRAFT_0037 [Pseudanabaena biceps PCC 7429]MDG3492968.1 hypothetical protein [Pseudanabaena catenata USMAC16]
MTEDIPADLLLRLRPNRCLYKAPAPYRGCGRPRKHGDKFQLANADSWGDPSATFSLEDETVGQVQIQQWSDLHFKKLPNAISKLFESPIPIALVCG